MKIYSNILSDIEIDVIVEHSTNELAANISKVHITPNLLDLNALQEYNDFIYNVMLLFEERNIKILDHHISDSKTSNYFYFKLNKDDRKRLVVFRISDHSNRWISNTEHTLSHIDKSIKNMTEDEQEYIKDIPKYKNTKLPRFKVISIIVNGETFNSYGEAESAIEHILDQYKGEE